MQRFLSIGAVLFLSGALVLIMVATPSVITMLVIASLIAVGMAIA